MRLVISDKYKENAEVCDFAKCIEQNFENGGTTIYNQRNVVKDFVLPNNCRIVVKKFKKPNIIQKLVYTFFKRSKAERAFAHAQLLRKREFGTPHEVAYIETYKYGFIDYCYYISEHTDYRPIRERLIEQEPFDKIAAENFALLAANLHKKNILHGDFNSTNVLYKINDNGRYAFLLIDLNRMKTKPVGQHFSKYQYLENLTRFSEQNEMFDFVLKKYAAFMNWDVDETFALGSNIKRKHDMAWDRRKSLLKKLKLKK